MVSAGKIDITYVRFWPKADMRKTQSMSLLGVADMTFCGAQVCF
jgi:hypothetical protein